MTSNERQRKSTISKARRLCYALLIYHRHCSSGCFSLADNERKQLQDVIKDIDELSDINTLSTSIQIRQNPQIEKELGLEDEVLREILYAPKLLIHFAAYLGYKDIVEMILKRHPEGKKAACSIGFFPLHYAAAGGNTEVVKLLLEVYPEGVDAIRSTADGRDGPPESPLHTAARCGQLKIIMLLIEQSPTAIRKKDDKGNLPLHWAAAFGHKAACVLLHNEFPDAVEIKGYKDFLPIHISAGNGKFETTKYLAKLYDAGLHSRCEINDLPIHLAVKNGHLEVIKYFIEHDASFVSETGQHGFIPLHLSAHYGHFEVAKYLSSLDIPGQLSKRDNIGRKAIHIAARKGHLNIVKYFLEKDSKLVHSEMNNGKHPIHHAVESGSIELVSFLLHQEPEVVCQKDNRGWIPLHYAACKGNTEIARLLHQSSPIGSFARSRESKSLPIHLAINKGHIECAKVMIEQGLSSSTPFARRFTLQIFDNRTISELDGRPSNNDSVPLWERRISVWAKFVDKFGIEAILQVPAFETFPMLPSAIGNVPVHELQSIIELLDLNLADIRDHEGQSILTVVIKKASEKEADWTRYYKPLLQLINSKLHDIDGDDDPLSARGNEVDHNILWNASTNAMPWYGLKDICICKANEAKMIVADRRTGLYPFMIPNMSQCGDGSNILSSSFKMLRMRPDVIKIIVNQYGNAPMASKEGRELKRRRLR